MREERSNDTDDPGSQNGHQPVVVHDHRGSRGMPGRDNAVGLFAVPGQDVPSSSGAPVPGPSIRRRFGVDPLHLATWTGMAGDRLAVWGPAR